MKANFFPVLFCFLLLLTNDCFSQDSTFYRDDFPSGISFQIKAGYFAISDEHISEERYSGYTTGFTLLFARYHETYGFRIGLSYEYGQKIKNYNVSAGIKEAALNFNTLYPVGSIHLFGKKTFIALGPGAGMFFYSRIQNIAQNQNDGLDIYKSLVWLFSFKGSADAILPLNKTLQIEGALNLGLVSFGGGTGNGLNKSTDLKFVTLLSGTYGNAEIGLRYYPWQNISLKTGYTLEIFRVDSWNYILAGSDNLFLSLGYRF